MNILLRAIAATALGLGAVLAWAAPTFQIDEIYSNADGAVQYVVLHEASGLDGQQAFAGGTLKVTRAGVTKKFKFPANLPSSSTAGRRVLVGRARYRRPPRTSTPSPGPAPSSCSSATTARF